MSSLSEFQDLVNDIKDEDLLNVAEELLKDMVAIQDMKEKIERLEEGLAEGKRAAFWFFAMGLDREQIDLATNVIIGRRRILQEKTKKHEEKKNPSIADAEPLTI